MRWHVLVVWAVALAATASARSLQRPRLTAATVRPDASPILHSLRGGLAATDDGSPLLLLLRAWECRDDPEHLRVLCDRLAAMLRDERAIDGLEAYLPQLAHMILWLPADSLLGSVLERFVLRVCESNVHWALQLSWIVYADLEENRPEAVRGDPVVFRRCASLLQLVEQSVVYGAKLVNRASLRAGAVTQNVHAWLEEHELSPRLPAPQPPNPSEASITGEVVSGARASSDIEGELLKRKQRDAWGVWRCCGESWTRRWFVMRDSVLYYYRARHAARARGAMPIGQCRIELRESPNVGPYIKLTARFSKGRVQRIRGRTPEETMRWLHALRTAAGMPPLAPGEASPAAVAFAAAHAAASAAPADAAAALAESPAPAQLSVSQRCSYLYLRAQRNFERSLAAVSEAIYTPKMHGGEDTERPDRASAMARLEVLLRELRPPPLTYLPLCRSSDVFCPVVRLPRGETHVFVTRERASVLLCAEVVRDSRGRKLSQLFEAVRRDEATKVFEGFGPPSSPKEEESLEPRQPADHFALLERAKSWFDEQKAKVFEKAPPDAAAAAAAAAEGGQAPPPADAEPAPPPPPAAPTSLDAVYGEPWEAKVRRLRASSPFGRERGWALRAFISKANDDVRQEVFVMQLLRLFAGVFPAPLWLRPYHILATGPRSGLIEMVADTRSLDSLKKSDTFKTGGMRAHFERHYGGAGSASFAAAQHNFLCSLAAYSMATYLLGIKDRHNGNILLSRQGHLVHIDFGFVLGSAPGGAVSLEGGAPFKLTREMVDVLGGPTAPLFTVTFVEMCTAALRAARAHAQTLLALVELTMFRSGMKCFADAGRAPLDALRERLMLNVPDAVLNEHVRRLVMKAYDNLGTRAYDSFQWHSNGIEA